MIKQLWRSHPYAFSGFVLAAAVTLFFMVRIVSSAIYWSDPAHHNEQIKPWMTVGYIAQSWHLDPRAIDALAVLPTPDQSHRPLNMKEIARLRGVPVADVIQQVQTAVAALIAQGGGND